MRFIIKCDSEAGYGFPEAFDYADFFPTSSNVIALDKANAVKVTLPWGVGTFTFGEYVINAVFEYNTVDFGYTEPMLDNFAKLVSRYTGQPTKWYQVPNRPLNRA
jgi:hypothetical protein